MTDRLTRGVVTAVIGIALIWAFFVLLPSQYAIAASVLLLYEGWTIANTNKYDTISDIIRDFSRKQLLTPWMFGFAFGIGIATGYILDPYVIAGLALLQGHWFFTLNEKREEAIKEEVKAEIKEERAEVRAEIRQDLGDRRRV